MRDQAMQYLLNRVRKTTGSRDFDLRMHGAIVDLLLSEIPLGPQSRRWIAELYLKLAFPDAKRDRKIRQSAQCLFADGLKQYLLQSTDKSPGEAEREVADVLCVSPETLRQRRSRKKRRVVTIHR
jgi:hypothetical protein